MPDHTNRYYDRPGFGNHKVPASSRQAPRGSQWPDGKHPRHGVTIFNRKPVEQTPKRERIGK